METPLVRVRGLSKSFEAAEGANVVLNSVDLEFDAGHIISLVGPNGSGKSTLVRILAGLEEPDSGDLLIVKDSSGPEAALMAQQYRESLLPWRSVIRNITLPSETVAFDSEMNRSVEKLVSSLGLSKLIKRLPNSLSGGQAQLVALARTLATPIARLFLLDEPFSALDGPNVRKALSAIRAEIRSRSASAIIVVHDLDLAVLLADEIRVLYGAGRISPPIKGLAMNGATEEALTSSLFLESKKSLLEYFLDAT